MTSPIKIEIQVSDSAVARDTIVKNMQKVDWDSYFMYRAFTIAMQSPDSQTKQGIVLVDTPSHRMISEGFNGFPAGADDANLPTTRPDKYNYIIHCEPNAFNWAAKLGAHFDDVTAYATMCPCETCARNHIVSISNLKITRLVYWEERDFPASRKILEMFPNITVEKFEGGIERILNSHVATMPLQYMASTPQTGRMDSGWTTNYSGKVE